MCNRACTSSGVLNTLNGPGLPADIHGVKRMYTKFLQDIAGYKKRKASDNNLRIGVSLELDLMLLYAETQETPRRVEKTIVRYKVINKCETEQIALSLIKNEIDLICCRLRGNGVK